MGHLVYETLYFFPKTYILNKTNICSSTTKFIIKVVNNSNIILTNLHKKHDMSTRSAWNKEIGEPGQDVGNNLE